MEIETAENTCSWLLHDKRYQAWSEQDQGLLWITGKPGAGKSTLMKFAVSHAEAASSHDDRDELSSRVDEDGSENRFIGEDVVLCFFFFGQGTSLQKSPMGFLRAILHQALPRYRRKLLELSDTFEGRCASQGTPGKDWYWHEKELEQHLFELLEDATQSDSIQLFVDALDECGEEDALRLVDLFERLMKQILQNQGRLKILFSCRKYPILHLENGTEIVPEESNQDDIKKVVFRILQKGQFLEARAREIGEAIVENSSGVFLWAVLVAPQVVDMNRKGKPIAAIKIGIKKIPRELHELYKRILLNSAMEEDDFLCSLKLFQWVCFTERRLSVPEMQHAMALDPDTQYKSVDEYVEGPDMAEDESKMARMINYLSKGLVEVRGNHVQVIHQSVHDFLVDEALYMILRKVGRPATSVTGLGHLMILRTCLQYLSLREIANLKEDFAGENLASFPFEVKYPLLGYSTTYWIPHASHVESAGLANEELLQYLYRTFNAHNWENWLWVHRELHKEQGIERGHFPESTLLHIAASFDLPYLFSALMKTSDNDMNCTDSEGQTPLWCAVSSQDERRVAALVQDKRVNPNLANKRGESPLHVAAQCSNILTTLLASDRLLMNAKDEQGWTPIFFARNHPESLKIFLSMKEIDWNAQDDLGRTLLWWIAHDQNVEAIKIILDRSDPDLGDANGVTPLFLACWKGYAAVVASLLCSKSISPDAKTMAGRTPLWAAVTFSRIEIVRLLLATGRVNPSTEDINGCSPLHIDPELTELLQREGNFSIVSPFSKTPPPKRPKPKRRYTPPNWSGQYFDF